jgi:hypothetical protein
MKYLDLLVNLNWNTFPSSENYQTHIKQNCQNQSLFKKKKKKIIKIFQLVSKLFQLKKLLFNRNALYFEKKCLSKMKTKCAKFLP